MPNPERRNYGAERVNSTQQCLIPPSALSSEEFQYYKHLYANVLNPQYPPRKPSSTSPLAAAAAVRHLAKDLASAAAIASARDLAFCESLAHSVNRPTGRSNLEKMSQQALFERLM